MTKKSGARQIGSGETPPATLAFSGRSAPEEGARGGSLWSVHRGDGPILASAIHAGAGVRAEVLRLMNLSTAERLREEDPHTDHMIAAVPTRIVVQRSRFEVDLNRQRSEAVYLTPAQAWGLDLWKQPLDDTLVARSLALHDSFYGMMRSLLDDIVRNHGRFILLDVHSYNHRRAGPGAAATGAAQAPAINIGTYSMPSQRWAHVVDAFVDATRAFDYRGRKLDVGIDIAFQGRGALTRFVHEHYPHTGCALAVEVKKFFMDEWTGVPFRKDIATLQQMFASLLPALESAIERP